MQQATDPVRGSFELRLLGPLEAVRDGRHIALGPPKQRALLVHLAVRYGEPVPVRRLLDELWPDGPPETARHAIQVYVSGLRRSLGEPGRISAARGSYSLHLEPGELDLARFRSLVAEGRAALPEEPPAAAARLRTALSLWRGRAFADLGGEPGVRDLGLDLEDERLQASELSAEAELAAGRHARVVPELERLLAEHPAREALYGHLMLALYRSGRQVEALEVYRRARSNLVSELGLEPSPTLRGLQAAVLRQDPSLTLEPAELRARLHLPAHTAVPAERQLGELVELVGSGGVRLVTLTGPEGAGKTRLAVAAAERLAASFPDGVWFVPLRAAREPSRVVGEISRALGVAEEGLAEHLRDRELLLVVDAFEHLLDAAPSLGAVVRGAPRVKLLTTSRKPLNLYGEHRYEVRPLAQAS